MTLQTAIDDIIGTLRDLGTLRAVPDDPPDNIIDIFPFAAVYDGGGSDTFGVAGERLSLDTIIVEVHVSGKYLPLATRQLMPFRESIPNAIMLDPTLGATVDTFGGISHTFGAGSWGEPAVRTYMLRFTVTDVKRRTNIA